MTTAQNLTLEEVIDSHTTEGQLYERLEAGRVRCYACGHRCLIPKDRRGICRVRFNRDSILYVPQGYVGALQADPVEKKPFFHALPGSIALTFGMLGCDLHCGYCQNWVTSQTLRDPIAGSAPQPATAGALVIAAKRRSANFLVSSYNEPLITAEWAVEVFKQARAANLHTGFVSNGNATREVLDYLRPWTDCYKIDLKSMQDKNYHKLGGVLANVLRGIEMVHELGFWLEVVTLVIPGFNDSVEELEEAASFLVNISADIPWHVTAFHKDYQMRDPADTGPGTLLRAVEIGRNAGLHYVYAGNLPGTVRDAENTYCPRCKALLIERSGYRILKDSLSGSGCCPSCGESVPGIWR